MTKSAGTVDPATDLVRRFYTAFQRGDGEAMAALYHPEAQFSDPVFLDLRGPRAGHMWRMLLGRASDLAVEIGPIEPSADGVTVQWKASYTFSGTGRMVRNTVHARLGVVDGLIHSHADRFDLWAWSRMALGLPGALLGWTPWMKNKIRSQALAGLELWEARNT